MGLGAGWVWLWVGQGFTELDLVGFVGELTFVILDVDAGAAVEQKAHDVHGAGERRLM